MDKLPVGQLPDLQQSNNDDEIMVITNSEYNQLKKEKISDLITDFTSTNENNALTKGTDGKLFVTDFGNASNITEGTLPTSVLPDIPKSKLPDIETADLPLSGVTADTYAYPSSVTVNAQGQVTAIEEGTPSGSNANTDLSNITDAGKEVIKENSAAGGLEVGDIGISLFVDETKGLRRYLNGSILNINANTQGFVNKLKSIAALYPSLTCSETEWQEIAAASAVGQCGKFVINEDAGTVRLAKIVMPIQGLIDLTKLGQLVEAGLPNIEGNITAVGYKVDQNQTSSGAIYANMKAGGLQVQAGSNFGIENLNIDASRSNPIYGNSDTVQPEQIQYPYFIQIATGQETEVNITNEIELNNPYTLFDSKYSEAPLYNASWLVSNGTYYSKSVYVTAYEALQVENNTAIDAGESTQLPSGTTYVKRGLSVKLSTADDITDYDFVINTTNETFRLPMKNGTEDLPSGTYDDLSLGASGTRYTAPANGWYYVNKIAGAASKFFNLWNNTANYGSGDASQGSVQTLLCKVFAKKGDNIGIQYNATGSTNAFRFVYAQGNGSLYYYVGETVQNANLINAGRIEEIKANKTDVDGQWVFGDNPLTLATSGTAGTLNLDLSNILPNDNYCYELLLSYSMHSSSSTISELYFQTDIQPRTLVGTAGEKGWYAVGTCIVITGSSHSLSRYIDNTTSNNNAPIYLVGYRRLGKNN